MLRAKKSLSQNFLKDKNICKKIVKLTTIKNKTIMEIGPGYGFMTDVILENNPKNIILIEKDKELIKYLNNKYKNNKKVSIIYKDILKFNPKSLKNLTIISNLPYNISTRIILYLFKFNKNISEMIFMIQKEVSLKFDYNLSRMNKYKFLTNLITTYLRCFDVSPTVFTPKPKVYSTVVKFKFNKKNFDLHKAYNFSNLIFKNVRKKINNNITLKSDNILLKKRINQLTIDELLIIYNLF